MLFYYIFHEHILIAHNTFNITQKKISKLRNKISIYLFWLSEKVQISLKRKS